MSAAKGGEADKEISVLQRIPAEPDPRPELGPHFDLTVPFARYVLDFAASAAPSSRDPVRRAAPAPAAPGGGGGCGACALSGASTTADCPTGSQ